MNGPLIFHIIADGMRLVLYLQRICGVDSIRHCVAIQSILWSKIYYDSTPLGIKSWYVSHARTLIIQRTQMWRAQYSMCPDVVRPIALAPVGVNLVRFSLVSTVEPQYNVRRLARDLIDVEIQRRLNHLWCDWSARNDFYEIDPLCGCTYFNQS